MAVLYFRGDQVAYFHGIDANGNGTQVTFSGIEAPFLETDLIEIEVNDSSIRPNGAFDPDEVIFSRVTVVRDGVRYDFGVDSGSKIKESGGGENDEQGAGFFLTNDAVSPPSSGPFSGLEEDKLVFSSDPNTSFQTGKKANLSRGDGEFDTSPAASPPPVPCFAPGTLILTPAGERRVEDLRVGDEVITMDSGPQKLVWARRWSCNLIPGVNANRPVRFEAGSLGYAMPSRDLITSPQHRLLFEDSATATAPEKGQFFLAAKSLIIRSGIAYETHRTRAQYVSLVFRRHEIIFANGLAVESFFAGDFILSSLPPEDRNALTALLTKETVSSQPEPVRPDIRPRRAQRSGRDRVSVAISGQAALRTV